MTIPPAVLATIDAYAVEHAAEIRNDDLDHWCFPAHEFEQRTGLRGIAQTHVMPDGMPPVEVCRALDADWTRLRAILNMANAPETSSLPYETLELAYAEEAARLMPRTSEVYGELERLNPGMEAVAAARGSFDAMTNVIWGMTSGFNFHDIAWYSLPQGDGDLPRDEAYEARDAAIRNALRDLPGWVLSPETQALILDQLRERERREEAAGTLEDLRAAQSLARST